MQKNNIKQDEFDIREKRILEMSDKILDKINTAIEEVDRTVIKLKEKQKTVEYDGDLKKPISEEVKESETVEIIDSVIDTASLKQLVATLKDVKDIHMGFLSGDIGEEEAEQRGVILISDISEAKGEDEAV